MDEHGKSLCMELKTTATNSKLRASQKRFLMGKNTAICRTREEIKESIEEYFFTL
jgi:hypothetical protein